MSIVSDLCCRAHRIFDWPHPPLQQDSILFATLMDVVSDTGDVDGGLRCAHALPAVSMPRAQSFDIRHCMVHTV